MPAQLNTADWRGAVRRFVQSAGGQFLLALAGLIVFLAIYWTISIERFYRAAIPAQIELTFGLSTRGSSASIFDALMPSRYEACGGAIFGLTDEAARAIREREINFFKSARQGRGYTNPSERMFSYYSYAEWQPTPSPREWMSEGAWYGLSCMGLWPGQIRNIINAAQTPGSFYSTVRDTKLLVIPSLQLVVYTYTH